jgi:hypothetical protein
VSEIAAVVTLLALVALGVAVRWVWPGLGFRG